MRSTDADLALARVHEIIDPERTVWDPKPGDKIAGIVVHRSVSDSHHSKGFPVLFVSVDGSMVEIRAMAKVIREEVETQDPQPGDAIGIVYEGEQDDYHAFRVVVVHTGGKDVDAAGPGPSPSAKAERHAGTTGEGASGAPQSYRLSPPEMLDRGSQPTEEVDPARLDAWARLVSLCGERDLKPAAVLAKVVGHSVSPQAAPLSALRDIEKAIGYVEGTPV